MLKLLDFKKALKCYESSHQKAFEGQHKREILFFQRRFNFYVAR